MDICIDIDDRRISTGRRSRNDRAGETAWYSTGAPIVSCIPRSRVTQPGHLVQLAYSLIYLNNPTSAWADVHGQLEVSTWSAGLGELWGK